MALDWGARAIRLAALLVLVLATFARASFLGTLLFGKDTLEPVREAIKQTEQLRQEVFGWYRHNATAQANFTVEPDPLELYTLLPATYSNRSLVAPDGSYYSNIKGYYKGEWTGWDFSTQANRSLAIDSRLNRTAAETLSTGAGEQQPQYLDGVKEDQLVLDRGAFHWLTAQPGLVDLRLIEETLLPGNVSLITGSLSFLPPSDTKGSQDSVDFSLEGLHFLPTGSLFLHAVGDEGPDGTDVRTSLGLIPHNNNDTMNATISAIDKAFQLRIDMLQRIIASGSYEEGDSSALTARKHNCSLHVYAQFQSAGPYALVQPQISDLEREMKHPTGISTIHPPTPKLALTAYSPECQLVLSAHEVRGLLESRMWKKAIHYAIVYFFVLLIQTRLLVQQMDATTTPSGLAKVSDKTWLAQSVLDAYGCLIHLSLAVALENETTVPLLACAFMSGMCFMAFGYRYTITIYRTQMDATPSPSPPAPAPVPAVAPPTESTAQPTATASVAEGQNEAPSNHSAPHTNFLHAVVAAVTADAASAEEIQARRRAAFFFSVIFFSLMIGFFPLLTVALMLPILYSFWIPQIYRNVQRGTRKAIFKRCVIGSTLTRLFVPLYILVCPENVFFSEPSAWGWVLAVYLVTQAAVLIGQDLMGPHWFLREQWVPEAARRGWEYHPSIRRHDGREDEEEVGGTKEAEYGDCAICLTTIEDNTSKTSRRTNGDRGRTSRGRNWFASGSSAYAYDRIASDAAEDFEVEPDFEDLQAEAPSQLYPPEKRPGRPRTNMHHRTNGSFGRRIRAWLARTIALALEWKDELGAASSTISGRGGKRRMDVMVAPCQHAFHTECLERWLEIKNECPSCRSALPPV